MGWLMIDGFDLTVVKVGYFEGKRIKVFIS
jgi:hypothetical protein